MRSISPLSGGSVCALAMAAAVPLTQYYKRRRLADCCIHDTRQEIAWEKKCWNCSCSFDRTYTGAGRRCRQASVQAIVLPCHDIGQDPALNRIGGRKSDTLPSHPKSW